MDVLLCVLAAAIAYLLGSVSFAYIITKLVTGQDIRNIGSGSAGTTNTARAVGKPLAALVMALDILKGFVSTEIGLMLAGETGGLLAFVFVALTGYVSAGSICACLLLIVSSLVMPEPLLFRVLYIAMACTVLFLHRANIKRLLNGTESKTFHKKK